jgi:hypothetical protein
MASSVGVPKLISGIREFSAYVSKNGRAEEGKN